MKIESGKAIFKAKLLVWQKPRRDRFTFQRKQTLIGLSISLLGSTCGWTNRFSAKMQNNKKSQADEGKITKQILVAAPSRGQQPEVDLFSFQVGCRSRLNPFIHQGMRTSTWSAPLMLHFRCDLVGGESQDPPISRRTPEHQVKLRWFRLNAAEGRRVFVCLLTRLTQLHLTRVLHVTDPPPPAILTNMKVNNLCWSVSALLLLITKSILVENGAFWRELQPAAEKKKKMCKAFQMSAT